MTSSTSASGDASALSGRSVALIYDCLFPLSHGGAERWYRALAEHVAAAGATVTYLTRRQWTGDAPTDLPFRVVDVSPSSELYDGEGVRRVLPTLAFGLGVFRWLRRHRHDFDAVHVASFPFFSLLGARLALAGSGTPIFVDFLEVWPASFWRAYAGPVAGTVGALVQRLCIAVTTHAQVFARDNVDRLRRRGFRGDVVVLPGLLPGERMSGVAATTAPPTPTLLFVGRHVSDKGLRSVPRILAAVRRRLPLAELVVVGDGPERASVEATLADLGLSDATTFTGRVDDEQLYQLFAHATCLVVPSVREGYGIVVVESAAAATPVVVVGHPENLATDLIDEGVNGFVTSPRDEDVADAIVRVVAAGDELRHSTLAWYESRGVVSTVGHSADVMIDRYRAAWHRSGSPTS